MSEDWESSLARWASAGLVDDETARSIREWEARHGDTEGRNRFGIIAFGLGGLLLVAGVLLFVASNWQELSPGARFVVLIATVAAFHAGGAFASEWKPPLSTTLHAAGTAAFGGAIFLSGQTFNLAANWPEGFLLWALGAGAALYVLRDWPHVLYVAVLVPLWLTAKAMQLAIFEEASSVPRAAATFVFLLALSYLFAPVPGEESVWRKSLSRLGALLLIPAAIMLAVSGFRFFSDEGSGEVEVVEIVAWLFGIGIPAALAYLLRKRDGLLIGAAIAWVLLVSLMDPEEEVQRLGILALYAAGSVGILLWGLRDRDRLPVNMGVIGFALSVLVFYFASDLFTKLGRSVGLIGAGLLFLGGGWFLERTRRTIIGKIDEAAT
ncbi:MAG: DUF2157 domain-containing protein [Actinomycetota bacterium]